MSGLGINDMLKSYLMKTNDKIKLNNTLQKMVAVLDETNQDYIDDKTLNAFIGGKRKHLSFAKRSNDMLAKAFPKETLG